MRWFVVCCSAPLAYAPPGTAHAHPPGPGFPRHAPSVYTTVGSPGVRVGLATTTFYVGRPQAHPLRCSRARSVLPRSGDRATRVGGREVPLDAFTAADATRRDGIPGRIRV